MRAYWPGDARSSRDDPLTCSVLLAASVSREKTESPFSLSAFGFLHAYGSVHTRARTCTCGVWDVTCPWPARWPPAVTCTHELLQVPPSLVDMCNFPKLRTETHGQSWMVYRYRERRRCGCASRRCHPSTLAALQFLAETAHARATAMGRRATTGPLFLSSTMTRLINIIIQDQVRDQHAQLVCNRASGPRFGFQTSEVRVRKQEGRYVLRLGIVIKYYFYTLTNNQLQLQTSCSVLLQYSRTRVLLCS